jgi:hypothetical protein
MTMVDDMLVMDGILLLVVKVVVFVVVVVVVSINHSIVGTCARYLDEDFVTVVHWSIPVAILLRNKSVDRWAAGWIVPPPGRFVSVAIVAFVVPADQPRPKLNESFLYGCVVMVVVMVDVHDAVHGEGRDGWYWLIGARTMIGVVMT